MKRARFTEEQIIAVSGGAIPNTSISGRRVARELTAIVERAASQE